MSEVPARSSGDPGEAELDDLVRQAWAGREGAYAPYSDFPVGAAVLTGGGVFRGANVENASYGATICAERVAAAVAVSAGRRDLRAVAVATTESSPTPPCGICRQFLSEFDPDLLVVSEGADGARRMWRLSELMPEPFGPADLPPPP